MLDMHVRPSELMDIDDAYLAFCFDEACAFIVNEMQDGKKPVIKKGLDGNGKVNGYSKPSDIYKKFMK